MTATHAEREAPVRSLRVGESVLLGLQLSPFETRLLREAADGLSTAESARRCNRSFHTIKTHRRHLLRKLGAVNVTHAVHLGHEAGLIGDRPARG